MSEFWFGSALLLVCAVAFIVIPVYLYRKKLDGVLSSNKGADNKAPENKYTVASNIAIYENRLKELEDEKSQGQISETNYTQLVSELQSTLLNDVEIISESSQEAKPSKPGLFSYAVIGLCVLGVAIASYGVYSKLGSLDNVVYTQGMNFDDKELRQAQQLAQQGDMGGLLQQLHSKLMQAPDNLEGWSLLARSAISTNEFALAAESYSQIIRLLEKSGEDSAPVYGLLAQARYYFAKGVISSDVQTALDKAFSLDKNEINSLSLLAINDFTQERYSSAISRWQQILILSPNHPDKISIETGIVRAQAALGLNVGLTETTATNVAKITVEVSIDPEHLSLVVAEDVVFVFARSTDPSGPPMPLAARRYLVKDLPFTVELTDQNAIAPMAKLSQVSVANIVVRISKSGQAIAQKGDLQGSFDKVPVTSGASVKVMINKVL